MHGGRGQGPIDSIVLGCAGMAPLGPALSRQVGAQVIDGVAAAVKLVESLVSLGLRTSKQGEVRRPAPQEALRPAERVHDLSHAEVHLILDPLIALVWKPDRALGLRR
ncbi:aspartate/glutamate racemase family protein [Streptomyces sp. NPDC019443]|uniref:aspartate/glutamate racemase family protein n=1 Tax=Streptomyces sp. NPDC019443 TaxID=3365061 RepID=UPI00379DDAAB